MNESILTRHEGHVALLTLHGANPPGICREVREVFAAAQLQSLQARMDLERQRQRVLLDAPSFREGVEAFQQTRPADFHRG